MSGVINEYEYIGKFFKGYETISFEYFKNYKKSRQPFYTVKCPDCKKSYILGLWSLRSEKSGQRCKLCNGQKKMIPNAGALFNSLFGSYKRQAKTRNYEFKIDKEYFKKLIDKNCYYCGIPPSNIVKNNNNGNDLIYNGIDRLDNNLGYTSENVVPCCGMCNRCKSNLSEKEFKSWIDRLINHNK